MRLIRPRLDTGRDREADLDGDGPVAKGAARDLSQKEDADAAPEALV